LTPDKWPFDQFGAKVFLLGGWELLTDQLLQLLGSSTNSIEFQALITANKPSHHVATHHDGWYDFEEPGFTVYYDSRRDCIYSIYFQGGPDLDFRSFTPYADVLPAGILESDSRKQAQEKLGS
jgi:hypothetical protein